MSGIQLGNELYQQYILSLYTKMFECRNKLDMRV